MTRSLLPTARRPWARPYPTRIRGCRYVRTKKEDQPGVARRMPRPGGHRWSCRKVVRGVLHGLCHLGGPGRLRWQHPSHSAVSTRGGGDELASSVTSWRTNNPVAPTWCGRVLPFFLAIGGPPDSRVFDSSLTKDVGSSERQRGARAIWQGRRKHSSAASRPHALVGPLQSPRNRTDPPRLGRNPWLIPCSPRLIANVVAVWHAHRRAGTRDTTFRPRQSLGVRR